MSPLRISPYLHRSEPRIPRRYLLSGIIGFVGVRGLAACGAEPMGGSSEGSVEEQSPYWDVPAWPKAERNEEHWQSYERKIERGQREVAQRLTFSPDPPGWPTEVQRFRPVSNRVENVMAREVAVLEAFRDDLAQYVQLGRNPAEAFSWLQLIEKLVLLRAYDNQGKPDNNFGVKCSDLEETSALRRLQALGEITQETLLRDKVVGGFTSIIRPEKNVNFTDFVTPLDRWNGESEPRFSGDVTLPLVWDDLLFPYDDSEHHPAMHAIQFMIHAMRKKAQSNGGAGVTGSYSAYPLAYSLPLLLYRHIQINDPEVVNLGLSRSRRTTSRDTTKVTVSNIPWNCLFDNFSSNGVMGALALTHCLNHEVKGLCFASLGKRKPQLPIFSTAT